MIEQLAIAFLGVSAAWLSQDARESRRRWACVLGLIGQPFWFWATYRAQQWGILALCFVYAWAWFRGFRLRWMTKK